MGASRWDDAEESPTGLVSVDSSDFDMVADGEGNQTVGIRFSDVPVPSGASIVKNASVQFHVDETTSVASALTIRGKASDNPASSRPEPTTSRRGPPRPLRVVVHRRCGARSAQPAPTSGHRSISAVDHEVVGRPTGSAQGAGAGRDRLGQAHGRLVQRRRRGCPAARRPDANHDAGLTSRVAAATFPRDVTDVGESRTCSASPNRGSWRR